MDAVPAAGRRASGGPTFELERFTWGTPDRLELEGRFAGLDQLPADPPVLVVHGGTRTQRLPAVAGGDSDADGHWQAAFAWQDAPAAFDSARLELGDTIAVDLPGPGLRRRPFRRQVLEVQWLEAAPAAGEAAEAGAASGPAGDVDAGPGTERLHLHADLLAAREEARELEAALQRATDELERVREDLDAARADHAADSERFREGLASVRLTAEEALVAERATAESTRAELARTTDELEDLRERLAAAEEARAVAEADASGLREQIDSATKSRDDLIAAHDDAERLLRRLTDIRDALEPGG